MRTGTYRILRLIAAIAMIVVIAVAGGAGRSYAQLTGSSFESNDGNMVVNTTGNEDWANAPNLTSATDTPSGQTDSSFANGAKEDFLSPGVGTGSVPPNKNDLIHFYTANETVGSSTYLYLGFTRAQTSGNADIDFEVNHQLTPSNASTGDPITPLNRTDGDALFQFIFPGGGGPITSLQIWRWATSSSSQYFVRTSLTNSSGCLSTSGGPPCWSDGTLANGTQFDGASNTTAISNPLDSSCSGNCLATATFGEAAVNLTTSNIFPAGTCTHFGDAWAKSRSADSGSSDLKDLIAPVPTNISNCGEVKVIKHTSPRGLAQDFAFTTTIPSGTATNAATFSKTPSATGSTTSFSLNDTGNTTGDSSCSNTVTVCNTEDVTNVRPGSYTVSEGSNPTGFYFHDLSCTASSGSSGSQDGTTARQADVSVAAGGTVTCTYTNQQVVSPTISTTLSSSSVSIGTTVHDSATLTGSTSDAGGTVTYTVYTDSHCSQGPQDAGTKTVTNGSVPDSSGITFNSAGTYYWQAVYTGDAHNNGATSPCTSETLVVNPNTTSISTAQNVIPNDSATIGGGTSGAGGSVTFSLYSPSDATCSGTPALTQTVSVSGNGTYSTTNSTFTASAEGTWRWQVSYTGDTNNTSSTSTCGVERFTIANH